LKVMLLYPEVSDMARFKEGRKEFPPFGVLYLAAVLEQHDYEVAIRKVTPDEYTLDLRGYDAVGFSLASSATYGMMLQARDHSLFRDDALIMVGGVHAGFYPKDSLVDFRADVVSYGESDETILEILERYESRRFEGITGVMWCRGDTIVRESPTVLMRDISLLPMPARHLLPQEDFLMRDRLAGTDLLMAHVMFSRGCPFPCGFCAAGQKRIQYRSGASARAELLHLKETYGIQGFAIVDDNFVVARQKVLEICRSIADLDLRWSALSRVDTVDEEVIAAMAAAGCIEIKFGMESGSERMLKAMRKNTTQAQICKAIELANKYGIQAKVFIIHGYPGENLESTRETIELLRQLGTMIARVSLFPFVPLPGTSVYDQPGIRGTHLRSDWDGQWDKFHIHHNEGRWWGSDDEWAEVQAGYRELRQFVEATWNSQG